MCTLLRSLIGGLVILVASGTYAQRSQRQSGPTTCGNLIPRPSMLPPASSGPVVYLIVPCFEAQRNKPASSFETYLSYIHLRPSRPSLDDWVPYDDDAKRTVQDDFRRLWDSGLLRELNIDVRDYAFANGVVGKLVIYNMQDR